MLSDDHSLGFVAGKDQHVRIYHRERLDALVEVPSRPSCHTLRLEEPWRAASGAQTPSVEDCAGDAGRLRQPSVACLETNVVDFSKVAALCRCSRKWTWVQPRCRRECRRYPRFHDTAVDTGPGPAYSHFMRESLGVLFTQNKI